MTDWFGARSDLIISAIAAAIICISVILIGMFADWIETLEYRAISRWSPSAAKIIVYRLTLPGTILHEYAHAAFGALFGAKITKISCFDLSGDRLGHVNFQLRGGRIRCMIQLGMLCCGPVFMGLAFVPLFATLGMQSWMPWWGSILCGYMMICVINHMGMSWVDVKNYLKSLWVVYPLIFSIIYVVRFFLIRGSVA